MLVVQKLGEKSVFDHGAYGQQTLVSALDPGHGLTTLSPEFLHH